MTIPEAPIVHDCWLYSNDDFHLGSTYIDDSWPTSVDIDDVVLRSAKYLWNVCLEEVFLKIVIVLQEMLNFFILRIYVKNTKCLLK